MKGSISKYGKSCIFAIYLLFISYTMKSSIKWAIVSILTPNLVSILKIIVLFVCAKEISKIYCSHCLSIVFYCFPFFVNNRTMEFSKIHKGTQVTVFWLYFWILTIKISILTKFQVHTFIFTETISICCFSLFWSKMTSFWPKMTSFWPKMTS